MKSACVCSPSAMASDGDVGGRDGDMARVMVRRYRGVEIEVVARGRAPATREGATAKLRVDVLRYTGSGSGRRARVSRGEAILDSNAKGRVRGRARRARGGKKVACRRVSTARYIISFGAPHRYGSGLGEHGVRPLGYTLYIMMPGAGRSGPAVAAPRAPGAHEPCVRRPSPHAWRFGVRHTSQTTNRTRPSS